MSTGVSADLCLVAGLVLLGFALLSALARYADGEAPVAAAVLALAGAALMVWAELHRPGGYSLAEVPRAVVRVVSAVVN